MSFSQKYLAPVKSALAVGVVAALAVAAQGYPRGDAAGLGAQSMAAGQIVAQAQDSASGKPKKKSKTRRPSPCGPGSGLPDCPTDGKSSSVALRLPA